jgi:hypothetical protein
MNSSTKIFVTLAALLLAPLAVLHAADKPKPESKPNILIVSPDKWDTIPLGILVTEQTKCQLLTNESYCLCQNVS